MSLEMHIELEVEAYNLINECEYWIDSEYWSKSYNNESAYDLDIENV